MELFNKEGEWEWIKHSSSSALALISINDYKYSVMIENYLFAILARHARHYNTNIPDWLELLSTKSANVHQIEFELKDMTNPDRTLKSGGQGITGTGHQYEIFTAVLEIMNDFRLHYSIDWWYFTASEPSRKKLYDRMVNRFGKEYFIIDIKSERHYVVKA